MSKQAGEEGGQTGLWAVIPAVLCGMRYEFRYTESSLLGMRYLMCIKGTVCVTEPHESTKFASACGGPFAGTRYYWLMDPLV